MKRIWIYLSWLRRYGLHMSPKAHRAAQFLEQRGKRFAIDFGTDNAISRMVEYRREQFQARRKVK